MLEIESSSKPSEFYVKLHSILFSQDLPNNMIHQVSIKSLPQEWLWCETWCDDTSKSKAKTIDLVSFNLENVLLFLRRKKPN